MYRFLVLTICVSILVSCGGGGGSSAPPPPTSNPPPAPPPVITSTGGVELGPVKDASISIETLDGSVLMTATTDDKGLFKIDVDELKGVVNRTGSQIDFVKVISTGGIDIDPDDDGVIVESEQIEVKGSVKGVVPLQTLYDAEEFRINFISTALMDILGDETSLSNTQISYIIDRLGIPDLNEDGVIDIDDLTEYNIKGDASVAETNLRQGYLEYIHNGDTEAQKLFIDELKYQIGFTRPVLEKRSGYYAVQLAKTDFENTIYYGIATDQRSPSYEEYLGQELVFDPNSALFYQECSTEYGCYRLQKVFFYEDEYYEDYDYELVEDVFDEIQEILEKLEAARTSYNEARNNRIQSDKKIKELEDKIKELQDKLDSI